MAHYPVNHRLRGAYRGLTAVSGLYLVAFGVVGLIDTAGADVFARGSHWSLGLRTNPAQTWLALLIGAVLIACAVIGGNLHHRVSMLVGWGLLGMSMFALAVLRTDANIFNFSVVNAVVLIVLGLAVLCAGLYGKVDDDPGAADREHEATLRRG